MPTTNSQTGTSIEEIGAGIYRVSTPVPSSSETAPGFSFNQILIAAEQPLLFHTGPRKMFPLVYEAVGHVLPPETLRYIGFSHTEGDECGSLDKWLAVAPEALPLCGRIAAMTFGHEALDRPICALADGETLQLGGFEVCWFDAPHVPHGWDNGFLAETRTRTLLCGDLFTQAGADNPALTEADILAPSEAMRNAMDYYSHGPDTRRHIERLASFEPRLLACMHGSAYSGDGGALLRALAASVAPERS